MTIKEHDRVRLLVNATTTHSLKGGLGWFKVTIMSGCVGTVVGIDDDANLYTIEFVVSDHESHLVEVLFSHTEPLPKVAS